MVERVKKLIKPAIVLASITFIVCCIVKKSSTISDLFSYIGYAITIDTIVFVLYEKYFWKVIPWNRPPILKKKYKGTIEFNYKNDYRTKNIIIEIKQTWATVHIKMKTDINQSSSITADIVSENNQDVLYYSYITSPTAMTEKSNPIPHGTCRMVLCKDNKAIDGKYWTSSKTTGDIHWTEDRKK